MAHQVKRLAAIFMAVGLSIGPALAQTDAATQSVISQLRDQGFEVEEVRRTLLGRVRVLSERGDLRREVVLDPRNGVILRDYTVDEDGEASFGPTPSRPSDRTARDDDDDRDDARDDDDDEDADDEDADDDDQDDDDEDADDDDQDDDDAEDDDDEDDEDEDDEDEDDDEEDEDDDDDDDD